MPARAQSCPKGGPVRDCAASSAPSSAANAVASTLHPVSPTKITGSTLVRQLPLHCCCITDSELANLPATDNACPAFSAQYSQPTEGLRTGDASIRLAFADQGDAGQNEYLQGRGGCKGCKIRRSRTHGCHGSGSCACAARRARRPGQALPGVQAVGRGSPCVGLRAGSC